jgi:plasmid segregation protein ParM
MTSTPSSILAIDVGFGNNKAVWGAPDNAQDHWKEICFPSMAPRVLSTVTVAGMGTPDRAVVTVGNDQFAVGPHASRLVGAQLPLHPNYIETPEYEALLCGAWHYYLRDIRRQEAMVDLLVLGLPVSNYARQRAKLQSLGSQLHQVPLPDSMISALLTEPKVLNVRARQVLVLPQPLGTLMLAFENPDNESLISQGFLSLVIDPGYSTFDWLVSDGSTPRMDISGSIPGGFSRLLRAVARQISLDHGIDAPELPRVDAALADGVLNTGTARIEMAPYHQTMEREASLVVSAFLQQFVPRELGIKRILLAGGAAKFYLRALQTLLPEYEIMVLPDSVMSNARGFYLAGRDLLSLD